MTIVTVREAETNLSKLIAEVLAGGEVVIAEDNIPSVRLVPVTRPGKRRLGALKGKIAVDGRFDEPLPDSELEGWHVP